MAWETIIAIVALLISIISLTYVIKLYKKLPYTLDNKRETNTINYLRDVREKPRKRYIVLQLVPIPRENTKEFVRKTVETGLRRILGDTGLVKMGFAFIEYEPMSGRLILQVYHKYLEHFLGSLGILNSRSEYSFVPLSVSGTLQKARRVAKR
ncbi:MAG: hypothetical protein F7C32_01690 [Desulfurococcales archaeon]|nr:hypothetical protein [Desulfurococcales archaeon]